jgi:hypothetical protein
MNFDNFSIGQVIQVFLINGGNVKGEFEDVSVGMLLMSNCTVKRSTHSARFKVNNCFMPVDCIKKIELG